MTRLLSGAALATLAVSAILLLPDVALRVVACGVAALAAREYLKLVDGSEAYLGAVVITTWIASTSVEGGLIVSMLMILLGAGFSVLAPARGIRAAIMGSFALIYIGMPLGLLANLHGRFGWPATLLLLATVVTSDTLQFYTGRLFGRHALAPRISPKKTIEGAVGGVLAASVLMALAGPYVLPLHSRGGLALAGALMAGFGILGDLFESRLKREADVKDSAAIIPGHGGVLDRIDALLFVTPVFFAYVERTT